MHGLDGERLLSFEKYTIDKQGKVSILYGATGCARLTCWF